MSVNNYDFKKLAFSDGTDTNELHVLAGTSEIEDGAVTLAKIDRNAAVTMRGSLAASYGATADLADATDCGIYLISSPNTFTGFPSDWPGYSGTLEVVKLGNTMVQTLQSNVNAINEWRRWKLVTEESWRSWAKSVQAVVNEKMSAALVSAATGISSSNYQQMGVTSARGVDGSRAYLIESSITAEMIPDLPVYGEAGVLLAIDPITPPNTNSGKYKHYMYFTGLNQITPKAWLGRANPSGQSIGWEGLGFSQVITSSADLAKSGITDMDKLPPSSLNYVNTSWFSETGDLPYSGSGYIATFGNTDTAVYRGWKMQVFMGTGTVGGIYRRNRISNGNTWLTWTPWTRVDAYDMRMHGGGQWAGKSWYAYGTSMTAYVNQTLSTGQTGKGYAAYLPNLSGLVLTNKGKGGSGIVPSLHGGLSGDNIYTRVMDDTDGKTGADLITLEILPNDSSAALGSITDVWDGVEGSQTETFLGCLANLLRHLQEATTAQIVVLITTASRWPAGSGPESIMTPEDKATYLERIEAVKRKCALYGVPVIDGFSNAGLGIPRMGTGYDYVGDQIHLVAAGGYNLAKYFWSQLKDIPAWSTTV